MSFVADGYCTQCQVLAVGVGIGLGWIYLSTKIHLILTNHINLKHNNLLGGQMDHTWRPDRYLSIIKKCICYNTHTNKWQGWNSTIYRGKTCTGNYNYCLAFDIETFCNFISCDSYVVSYGWFAKLTTAATGWLLSQTVKNEPLLNRTAVVCGYDYNIPNNYCFFWSIDMYQYASYSMLRRADTSCLDKTVCRVPAPYLIYY